MQLREITTLAAADQLPATPAITLLVNIFDSLWFPSASARWRLSPADKHEVFQFLQEANLMEVVFLGDFLDKVWIEPTCFNWIDQDKTFL